MGAVIETQGENRFDEVAADYIGEAELGRSVLVVAPTHREKDAISDRIRRQLSLSGKLGDDGRDVLRLRDTRWTEAERRDADRYQSGMVVKTFQNMPGLKAGSRLNVVGRGEHGVVLVWTPDGDERALPLDRAKHFKVYRRETLSLAEGDLVRLTEQGVARDGQKLPTGK